VFTLKSSVAAATLMLVALATIAGPVAASPMPPSYGSAVKCIMAVTQSTDGQWTEAKLRRVTVFPPVMYATADGNEVGWRFILFRSIEGGPYKRIERSRLQKVVGLATDSADFSPLKARITLPVVAHPEMVKYRVRLVMFHYEADGTIHSRTTFDLPNHFYTFDGRRDHELDLTYCVGTATRLVEP